MSKGVAPYIWKNVGPGNRRAVGEHVLIAERLLGRRLRRGIEIHHVDGNGRNNEHTNLVICENRSYHYLLHRRREALLEYGDANAERCMFCRQYDTDLRYYTRNTGVRTNPHHPTCKQAYDRKQFALRRKRKCADNPTLTVGERSQHGTTGST